MITLGLGVFLWLGGGIVFSPGKLTAQNRGGSNLEDFESHAEFETECERCHAPLETSQADLCTRCHTGILGQVATGAGTHANIVNIQGCRTCHPDHLGRDFDPTQAAYSLYDHEHTRFTLRWHQVDYDMTPLDCHACHEYNDLGFSLTPIVCEDCHTQNNPTFMLAHIADFSRDCLSCHDGSGSMANFDHQTTSFPLEGAHSQVECADCHVDSQFAGLPVDCVSCHSEPVVHAGLFSRDCAACHSSLNWSAMTWLADGEFDHFEQAGFSLNRHITDYAGEAITCSGCHTPDGGTQVAFDLGFCEQCHTQENPQFMQEHQDQFGADCLTCHDGVDRMHDFDHNRIFLLDGAHAEAACESCHTDRLFIGTPSECVSCHQEPEIHAGYFGLDCENCHTTTAWAPAKLVNHTFPLDHGGEGVSDCQTCHLDRYTEYTCYECHEHQPDEILEEHLEEGISAAELPDCVSCHPTGLEGDD